ncbi:MAG: ASKHA domain-containing protein, partial [Candidatus Omnitrophica bacterium]|nr:ASKHA domain-containing protein [Candidatus Omnitrophota bacterium]
VEMGDFIKWAKAGVKRDDLEGLVVDLYSNPDSSIALMRRIMDLKINNPDNFYYILGNHDLINYHWSKRGPCGFIIDQSIPYREALEQRFGSKYLDLYRKFVEASPVLLLADDLIATHAGPIKGSFNSQKLKNLPTTNLKNPILVNLLMGRFCGYSHKGEEAFSYSQEDLNSFIGSLGYDIKDCWFIVGHTPTQEGFFKRVLFNHYLISGCEREFGYFSYRKNKGEFVAVQDNGSSHLPPSSVNLVGVDRGPTVKMNAGICFGRFNEGIKLCKISKVPVKLHWSFFIVLALAAGNGLFSLAFLLSIFTLVTLHEFAHIKAAAKYGIGTIQVLLTALGGVATLESCGFTPRQQRKIASAGPLFNLFLAVVLFLLLFSIAPFEAWHFGLSSWFGLLVSISYANLMLGLFNLLPVFPLDGGRIFRSLMISSFGLDRIRATELTLKLSRVFALGFIVLPFLLGSYPVLFAIGVFILVSAPGQAKSAGYSHPVSSTEMRMAADKFIGEPKVAEGFLKLSEALGVLEDYIASSGKINGPPVNKQMLLGDIDTSSVVAWRSNPGKVIWNLDTTNIKRILLPTKFSGQFVIEQIHIHESGKDEDDAISSQAQFLRSDNPLKLLALKFLKETGELIKTIDDRFDPLKCFIHGKPKGDDSVFLENRVLAYAEFVRSFGIFEPSYPYFYQIIEDVFLNGAAVLMYAKGSDQVYACLNELRLNIEVMSFLLRHDCLDSLKECWISSERIALPTSLVVKILGIRESLAGKHIFGKGIKEWAGSHGLFLKQHPRFYPIPGENEQYAYDIRVYTTKGYACRTLKSVEAFILSEAGRVGETVGVTRWINNLKRAALNNGKPQIEFLLGRNGPFYWAARIHAFERCRLAHLKRLFGIVDISDTSLDKLPIWPVDNNGYIRADLIDWISQDNGIPPAQYYEVEKFSLEQLPKFKTTDLITGFNGLAFMPLALSFFSGLNSEFSWEGVIFTGILTFFLLYFGKAYLFFKSRSRNETEERKSPIHLTDPMTPRIEDISNPAEKKKAIFNIYKPVAVDERGNYIFGVVPVSEDEEYVWDSTLPQVRDRSDLQAASFLRKKGAVNPEIIEVLGQLKDYLYIDNAPDYLKEEIARQEQEGVKFLVARLDNALATSYRGKETYLSNVLFNPKYPAPLGLIYMYIRHEAKKHSNLKSEAEAVRREVDAYNSLSSEERGKVKNWGDWYVRELERRGLDRAKNIINYSFFELARKIQDNPDSLFLEDHFVIAHYGEIHLKKRFEFEKRLYSFFVIVIFSICFIPVLLGYSHVVMAVTGFFSCALIYFIFCRYLGAIHLKYFALDSSLADDYKKVVSGMPNEGRVYIKNLLQVINAYKYHPSWRYAQARVRIITLHFLSQIVQLQSFGEKTELELAPKGALVRSPVRSNVASLMLIEHLLASTEETFSEPAWVSLVKVVAENRDRWLGPVLSVMSSAVHISYCADNLVKLLYKADNKQLDRYKIKDIEAFRNSLYELIILLAQEHKDFKCQAILCLCDSIQHGRGNETIFAVNLLRELKFHIVEASNFSMVSSDVASGIIKDIIEKSGHANIAFGAGSTITKPYQYGPRSIPSFAEHLSLRKQDFNWDEQVKAWQLSEYASLDSGHPFSQAYALKESLFSRIFNAVENNVSFIGDSPDPRGYVEKQNQAGGIDLIISGVGADGHFGYNFPGTTADPSSAGRLVKVRLTPEVMSSSHESYPDIEKNPFAWTLGLADIIKPTAVKKPQVIVLVLGKKKAQMLRESLEEADSPLAKIIRELDTTIIVADEAVHSLILDYLQRCSAAMRSIYGKEKNKYYSIDLAVHMIDNKGNIVWVNRAWEKLFGFSEEQVIGQPVWFFVNEENQVVSEARVKDKLSKRIENLPDIPFVPFRRAEESTVKVDIREWQVTGEAGEIVGIISTFRPTNNGDGSLSSKPLADKMLEEGKNNKSAGALITTILGILSIFAISSIALAIWQSAVLWLPQLKLAFAGIFVYPATAGPLGIILAFPLLFGAVKDASGRTVPEYFKEYVVKALESLNSKLDLTFEFQQADKSSAMVSVPWISPEDGPDVSEIKRVQDLLNNLLTELKKNYPGYSGKVYIYSPYSGAQMNIVQLDIEKEQRRKVEISLNPEISSLLHPEDMQALVNLLTTNQKARENCRSEYINLLHPISVMWGGKKFILNSIYAKGVVFDENEKLTVHEGLGAMKAVVISDENGLIKVVPNITSPQGAFSYERAKGEFDITYEIYYSEALQKERIMPKYPFGYVRFPDSRYEGQELGCVLLGCATFHKDRSNITSKTDTQEGLTSSHRAGEVLKIMHKNGFLHPAFHSGNFLVSPGVFVIHDLDCAQSLRKDNDGGRRYLAEKLCNLYYAAFKLREASKDFSESFLKGYFGQDVSLDDLEEVFQVARIIPVEKIHHRLAFLIGDGSFALQPLRDNDLREGHNQSGKISVSLLSLGALVAIVALFIITNWSAIVALIGQLKFALAGIFAHPATAGPLGIILTFPLLFGVVRDTSARTVPCMLARVRNIHHELLRIAYARVSGEDVTRRLSGLKIKLINTGLLRTEEIIGFIEAGNEFAACAILSKLSSQLTEEVKAALNKERSEAIGRQVITEEVNGKITILFRGKYETHTLYRWQRKLDAIINSLAAEGRDLQNFRIRLWKILERGDKEKIKSEIPDFEKYVKGSQLEDKKEVFRKLETVLGFLFFNRLSLALETLNAILPLIDLRLADIEGEDASLDNWRQQLRLKGSIRLNRVQKRIDFVNNLAQSRVFTRDCVSIMKDKLGRLLSWPFLSEPDFTGMRNEINRSLKLIAQLAVPKRVEKKSRELLDKLAILKNMADTAAGVNEFMIKHGSLINHAADRQNALNLAYQEWAASSNLVRGAPRYWKARLYRAVFISEKNSSQCFKALETILIAISICEFRKLFHSLKSNRRNHILSVLLSYTSRKPAIVNARYIPVSQRDSFLVRLIEAARKDYKLDEKAKDEDIAKLYQAFDLECITQGNEGGLVILPPETLNNLWTLQMRFDNDGNFINFVTPGRFIQDLCYILENDLDIGVELDENGEYIFNPRGTEKVKLSDALMSSIWNHEFGHFEIEGGDIVINPDEAIANSRRGKEDFYLNTAAMIWYWFYFNREGREWRTQNIRGVAIDVFIEELFIQNPAFSFLAHNKKAIAEISRFATFINIKLHTFAIEVKSAGNLLTSFGYLKLQEAFQVSQKRSLGRAIFTNEALVMESNFIPGTVSNEGLFCNEYTKAIADNLNRRNLFRTGDSLIVFFHSGGILDVPLTLEITQDYEGVLNVRGLGVFGLYPKAGSFREGVPLWNIVVVAKSRELLLNQFIARNNIINPHLPWFYEISGRIVERRSRKGVIKTSHLIGGHRILTLRSDRSVNTLGVYYPDLSRSQRVVLSYHYHPGYDLTPSFGDLREFLKEIKSGTRAEVIFASDKDLPGVYKARFYIAQEGIDINQVFLEVSSVEGVVLSKGIESSEKERVRLTQEHFLTGDFLLTRNGNIHHGDGSRTPQPLAANSLGEGHNKSGHSLIGMLGLGVLIAFIVTVVIANWSVITGLFLAMPLLLATLQDGSERTVPETVVTEGTDIKSLSVFRQPWLPLLGYAAAQIMKEHENKSGWRPVSVAQACQNSKDLFELMVFIATNFNMGAFFVPMDLTVEAEAVALANGVMMQVNIADDKAPEFVSPLETMFRDDRILFNEKVVKGLKIPQPLIDGRLRVYLRALEAIDSLQELDKRDWTKIAYITGPYTLAVQLLGIDALAVYKFDEERPVFDALMRYCVEVVKSNASAFIEAGADVIMVLDPSASLLTRISISETMAQTGFERYCEKPINEVAQFINSLKIPVLMHSCITRKDMLTPLSRLNVQGYSLDSHVDIREAYDILAPLETHKIVIGNIDTTLLAFGPLESIEKETCNILNKMQDCPNFILASACDIPPITKEEYLLAIQRICSEWFNTKIFNLSGPLYTIQVLPEGRIIRARKGENLLDVLERHGFKLNTACGKQGVCGRCGVRLIKGSVKEGQEIIKSDNSKMIKSCQSEVVGEIDILIPFSHRITRAKILGLGEDNFLRGIKDIRPLVEVSAIEPAYALAVDIGTTTVVASLIPLKSPISTTEICTVSSLNWQAEFGADVISRISYIDSHNEGLRVLQGLVISAINSSITNLVKAAGVNNEQIRYAVFSGNSTMAHISLGLNPHSIGQGPDYKMVEAMPSPRKASQIGLKIFPEGEIFTIPCVHGYLGGDIVSDLLIAKLKESEDLCLMIDLGTNGEIILGSKDGLVSTTCAMGPAFEGMEISSGTRAQDGAIEKVFIDKKTLEPEVKVIGNGMPVGICGSGLIDGLAQMYKCGIINEIGRINQDIKHLRIRRSLLGGYEYVLWQQGDESIVINERDIESILKAKAAVAAAIKVLLRECGKDIQDISRIYVAGGFGQYINIEEAVKIGLLPLLRDKRGMLARERYIQMGNGSLKGAILSALDKSNFEYARVLSRQDIKYVDLMEGNNRAVFEDEWINALIFNNGDGSRTPQLL